MRPRVLHQVFEAPEQFGAAVTGATLDPCQLSRDPAPSEVTRLICPQLCLDLVKSGPAMWYDGQMPGDRYTLSFVARCPGNGRSLNFSTDFGAGYMGFFTPGGVLDAYNPPGCANALLTVPTETFHEILDARRIRMPEAILKHGAGLEIPPPVRKQLAGMLGTIERAALADRDALDLLPPCQLAGDLLERFVNALAAGCGAPVREPGMRLTRRQQRFRTARDFLRARAHESVRVHDLCRELELSERAVENLFRDFTGIGPVAYLRQRRLHAARERLLRAGPAHGAVKRAAYESGFWHLGRFSSEYRALFGESPGDTLRR